PLLWRGSVCSAPAAIHSDGAHESQALLSRGLDYAGNHVGRLPVVAFARLGRTFEFFRPLQGADFEAFYEGADLTVERAGLVVFYLLAALAVAGALQLRRHKAELWILLAPFVLVALVSVTSYGFTRFRVAAEPSLIVLAAV